MRSSIFLKNLFSTLLLILICLALLGGVSMALTYTYVLKNEHANLSSAAQGTAHLVAALSDEYPLGSLEMQMNVSVQGDASGYDIMVSDSDGIVKACSEGLNCPHIGTSIPDPIWSSLKEKGSYQDNYSGATARYVIALTATQADSDFVGYVVVAADRSDLSQVWRASFDRMMAVALVVLVLAILVSWVTTRHTIQPIREITKTVNSFARGDLAARVHVDTGDELGLLADSFNLMADALERQDKQRSEFIANISHELKTPMTTISGFADGILDGTIPPEKQNEYLTIISNETHRLSRLVRSMLNISSLSAKDPEALRSRRFDLTELIFQTMLSLESKINDKKLDVDADFPEEAIFALGDRDSITQVVYNLLDNAVKFATEGTTLGVSLWKQSGRAYVAISDHGLTIPPDDLPFIFDRFHKSDKSRSVDKDGVGLGLYLVKSILDNHREDIFVTSADGLTTFTFTLTIAPGKGTNTP